ncbi:SEC-C domain-containing protein [Kushneria indalinina]|uniref:SEC-C motif-containing protein n=1 Tax=Kushneria indalinina DSM 14324 TaxID=1122140 RepID=A0A3D9DZ91_9GAMM|nr:SEC-C domain-containing protein [Kushneria indalinina]REC96122.1 SEC-C motif-containing protein [Kushneria indalinina DSM 14324]
MLAAWVDQLLGFSTGALDAIRRDERYPSLMAWARKEGAELLGADVALAQALAPVLWNQMPLQRLGFRIETLAVPAPQEPCWCDSGKRYADCCARVTLPGQVPPHLMWMLLLQRLRGKVLHEALASDQVPAQALLEAGIVSAEGGQLGRAQTILEALFNNADWEGLPQESEPAFELLSDVYQERGFTRKKAALMDSAVEHGPGFLRGAALKRLCLRYMDSDDLTSARETFIRTLETMPNEPALAYLESMLLLHEGRPEQARARADFWRRRLIHRSDLDEDQQAFLKQLAEDPEATLAEQMIYADEELAEPLETLTRILQEFSSASRLSLSINVEGRLEYQQGDLDDARYQMWQQHFTTENEEAPGSGLQGDPWRDARPWLDALCLHPEWLATPAILQELAMALAGRFGNLPWMFASIFSPLAQRFEDWLVAIEAADSPFVWGDGDNHVLFRLGLGLIIGMERGAREQSRQLAERLIRLDGEDSMGLRELLLEQLLSDGQDVRALTLIEEIEAGSDDGEPWLGLLLGKALALFRLARLEEARQALTMVEQANPWMLKLLIRDNPRREPVTGNAPIPGSRAEAWQYRVLMRPHWVATRGAIGWLDARLRAPLE